MKVLRVVCLYSICVRSLPSSAAFLPSCPQTIPRSSHIGRMSFLLTGMRSFDLRKSISIEFGKAGGRPTSMFEMSADTWSLESRKNHIMSPGKAEGCAKSIFKWVEGKETGRRVARLMHGVKAPNGGSHERMEEQHIPERVKEGEECSGVQTARAYYGAGGAIDRRLVKLEAEIERCRDSAAFLLIDGTVFGVNLNALPSHLFVQKKVHAG